MNWQNRAFFFLLAGAAGLLGCSSSGNVQSPVDESVSEPSVLAGSWPALAVVDWGQVDFNDPSVVRDFAQADILLLETNYLWPDGMNPGAIAALKDANPAIKVIGYFNAHSSWLSWGEVDRSDSPTPVYAWDWYQATREYWSYTTTGDTMMSWPGKVLLNILDPGCRAAMVRVLADHWYAHDNVLDGIMWDHFNSYLWVPLAIEGVQGELDLDGDGIPHRQDEDEMQAYRDASTDLLWRAQRALGRDVIQIANGQRAPADSAFASLLDGMFYENFPEYNYSGEKMRKALDPSVPNNLFAARTWPRTRNGGPYLILANPNRFNTWNEDGQLVSWRLADFNRVVGLLAGCLPVYFPPGLQMRYGWPEVDVELGQPLGDAILDGDRVSRQFELGSVHLDFSESTPVVPFKFAIVQKGAVAQHYDMEEVVP